MTKALSAFAATAPDDQDRFWSNFAYHRGETRLRNRPAVFAVEATNFCNIKCIMCPRGEPDLMRRPLGHMSDALLEKILSQAARYTDPTWFHWFGEPLMNPRLLDQIALAKRFVPNLGISTNATLLSEANREKLLASPLDTLMIALDGDSPESYDNIRISERFGYETVSANIAALLTRRAELGQRKPHIILSIIVMERTAAELHAFADRWRKHGADEILFKPYTNWAGQHREVFDALGDAEARASLSGRRAHPCKWLWDRVVVSWDGKVLPCCLDYDTTTVMGDLNTQTLDEIWNGPAYVAMREAEAAGRNGSPLCINCAEAPGHPRNPEFGARSRLLQSPPPFVGG